jgi:hypothetical protein
MSMPPAGVGDIPGIGAIVAAGDGDGAGTVLLRGAGVLIGMPGMGAIVGSAAIAAAADLTRSAATRERRKRSNDDLGGD